MPARRLAPKEQAAWHPIEGQGAGVFRPHRHPVWPDHGRRGRHCVTAGINLATMDGVRWAISSAWAPPGLIRSQGFGLRGPGSCSVVVLVRRLCARGLRAAAPSLLPAACLRRVWPSAWRCGVLAWRGLSPPMAPPLGERGHQWWGLHRSCGCDRPGTGPGRRLPASRRTGTCDGLRPHALGRALGPVVPTLLSRPVPPLSTISRERTGITAGWRARFSHCLLFNPTDVRSAAYNPCWKCGAACARGARRRTSPTSWGIRKALEQRNHWEDQSCAAGAPSPRALCWRRQDPARCRQLSPTRPVPSR